MMARGSRKVRLSRAHGPQPTRSGRSARVGAASLFAGVALLVLAGCGGSGPTAGSPAGQTGSSAAATAGTGTPAATKTTGTQPAAIPEPAHTVVVVMENHSYADIIGNPAAPFINELARRGALFTRSYAITHPSEPNYLALFSGSTQGVADDGCPYRFTAPNLAADLLKSAKSFAGYAEDLPGAGSPVCSAGEYAASTCPGPISATCPARSACPSPASPPPTWRGCRRCPS